MNTATVMAMLLALAALVHWKRIVYLEAYVRFLKERIDKLEERL